MSKFDDADEYHPWWLIVAFLVIFIGLLVFLFNFFMIGFYIIMGLIILISVGQAFR